MSDKNQLKVAFTKLSEIDLNKNVPTAESEESTKNKSKNYHVLEMKIELRSLSVTYILI